MTSDPLEIPLLRNILEGLSVQKCFFMLMSSSYGRAGAALGGQGVGQFSTSDSAKH